MAEYIGIKGSTIQTIAGDPPAPIEGQVWYNSSAGTLKAYGSQGTGAWAAGGNLNEARSQTAALGIQSSAQLNAGSPDGGSTATTKTEQYNGSAWTEVADTNTARWDNAAAGTQTAGLTYGGGTPGVAMNITESWDGTSWSEVNDLNTPRKLGCQAGIQTAALAMGGENPGISYMAHVETYDGTSWTEGNNLPASRSTAGGTGTTTSAIMAGGNPTGPIGTSTLYYEGTSWTEGADINTGGKGMGAGGNISSAIIFGGQRPGVTALAEQYDGSTWTEVADLALARDPENGGCGTGLLAMICGGGYSGTTTNNAEEWTVPDATKTFTAS